jgi:hypothetical protein
MSGKAPLFRRTLLIIFAATPRLTLAKRIRNGGIAATIEDRRTGKAELFRTSNGRADSGKHHAPPEPEERMKEIER